MIKVGDTIELGGDVYQILRIRGQQLSLFSHVKGIVHTRINLINLKNVN